MPLQKGHEVFNSSILPVPLHTAHFFLLSMTNTLLKVIKTLAQEFFQTYQLGKIELSLYYILKQKCRDY